MQAPVDAKRSTHTASYTELAIIVPVYNEADNFPRLVQEVERQIVRPKSMYIVYDFDEDTTVPVARSLASSRPWLKLVKNQGRGVVAAIRTGFNVVQSGPALVMMADLSDDLTIVDRMLELYGQGYRIVCPSRYMRGGRQLGGPLVKRTLSRLAGLSLWHLVRFPTHDATNNYRLYDAALVRELGIESVGGFELALELTAKAFHHGVKIAEVPTIWRDRQAGSSRFKLMKWLPRYLSWYAFALRVSFRGTSGSLTT
jgi:dolichol-phosphate mannosyltransferase